jgi:hypothetical protein
MSITFFIIVTKRDFTLFKLIFPKLLKLKISNVNFIIYCNCLESAQMDFLKLNTKHQGMFNLVSNDFQFKDKYVTSPEGITRHLEGEFESCDTIWSNQLKVIQSDLICTLDADFEILDIQFIKLMIHEFEVNNHLAVYSTDYTPNKLKYFDSYSKRVVNLHERYDTWFCIYRKEILDKVSFSHYYFEEKINGELFIYDSSAKFQSEIKNLGFELKCLDHEYQHQFIHYGAFSKNRGIKNFRLKLYRLLAIYAKVGIGPTTKFKNISKKLVLKIFLILFKSFNESRKTYD